MSARSDRILTATMGEPIWPIAAELVVNHAMIALIERAQQQHNETVAEARAILERWNNV